MYWRRKLEEATRFSIWLFFCAFGLMVAATSHTTWTSWGWIALFIILGAGNAVYLTFRGYSQTLPSEESTFLSLMVGVAMGVLVSTSDLLQVAVVVLYLAVGIVALRELFKRIYEFLAGLMNGGIGGAISSDKTV